MTRFFIFLIIFFLLFTGLCIQTSALGVTDFVAVADGPSCAVYNPAGLSNLNYYSLNWEHCFVGRDQSIIWDDSAVYISPGESGNGALFVTYSQDLVSVSLLEYNRVTNYGYCYGWKVSDRVSVGLGAKYSRRGLYSNSSGIMIEDPDYAQNDFLIDFGLLSKPSENWRFGLSLHNLGRDTSEDVVNYQSTMGFSYQWNSLVLAGEIYDLLNEGGMTIRGTLYRLGCRLDFHMLLHMRVHAVVELSEWDYQGTLLGLEFRSEKVNYGISRYSVNSTLATGESINATVGINL